MTHSRLPSLCFICFFIAACNNQEPSAAVNAVPAADKAAEIPAIEKAEQANPRPALHLSIENIPAEQKIVNDNSLSNEETAAEKDNDLFKKLSSNQLEPKVNLSGKLLTDNIKLENKGYLHSVDGVQINIEGQFN